MIDLLRRLPLHWSYRHLGWPVMRPFSLVLSVSYKCNSRCRTCGVWRRTSEELTSEEWQQVFASLGRSPSYLTFTGGEPFLRPDFAELVCSAYFHCRPSVITIPTNGLLTQRIVADVARICEQCPESEIGLNLSLDGLGQEHDEVRGVPGNWTKAQETWQRLKALQPKHKNLMLSIHTVVSRFNIDRIRQIREGLLAMEPDSFISEVAEERVELDTMGWEITPSPEAYAPVADYLSDGARMQGARGIAKLTQAFRAQYYQLAKRILIEQRQAIACFAGWSSGHIAPNGDVWTCCIRAEPVGNLRETNYDLRPIWSGERMKQLRDSIAAGECACPMANASYTNMLLHVPTLLRVGIEVVRRN